MQKRATRLAAKPAEAVLESQVRSRREMVGMDVRVDHVLDPDTERIGGTPKPIVPDPSQSCAKSVRLGLLPDRHSSYAPAVDRERVRRAVVA
jgi:hypothetical protein